MVDGLPLDPDELEHASFQTVRRGFEQLAVQRRLQQAAAAIRDLARQRDALAARLAEYDEAQAQPLEAHRVAEALGAEATLVLESAHAAAKERSERAEREAEAIHAEAVAAAEATRAEGVTARDELLAEARREAEEIAEEGRQRGREMVNEAQTVRERMLSDLARKRQTGRAQVEQLRAGRDRLLESLSVAQSSLDTAMKDLVDSVPEARGAAERAGLRVTNEVTPSVDALEAEIEAARLVGHPLVEGIVDPGAVDDGVVAEPDPAFVTAEMEALTHLDEALEGSDSELDSEPSEEADASEVEAEAADSEPEDLEAEEPVDELEADNEDEDEAEDSEEEEGESAQVDGVDDLFARLRQSQVETAEDSPEVVEPDDDGDESEEDGDDEAEGDEVTEAGADEVESLNEAEAPNEEAEPESEPEEVDPLTEARARAESMASRALKKVLVDEQSTLLDGVRRSGGDAVAVVVADADAHAAPYESAISEALDELIETLGGDPKKHRDVGFAQIRAIALDPVRQRLLEVAERSEDSDELSDTVRGLYRESRSRRLPMASAAAVSSVTGAVTIATADGPVSWMVDPSGPCGPDCADNALAGAIEAGTAFPTGALHPPADPTCTCFLVVETPD